MCEKNLEGKVLSPSSKDDKDEVVPSFWEPVKKSKKKKRSRRKIIKTKYCKTCHQDILENETRDMLMFIDTYHQLMAKDYCKEHELSHSNHKCKPKWCDKCGYLINYEIIIDHNKWDR